MDRKNRTVEHKGWKRWTAKGVAVLSATAIGACGVDQPQPQPVWPVTTEPKFKPTDVPVFDGGCDHMPLLYAQDVADPRGALGRIEPSIESQQIHSYLPDQAIRVTGWYDSGVAAYPENPNDFNGRVWYYDADNGDWVNSAAVRTDTTKRRGKAAPRGPVECEIVKVPVDSVVEVNPTQ